MHIRRNGRNTTSTYIIIKPIHKFSLRWKYYDKRYNGATANLAIPGQGEMYLLPVGQKKSERTRNDVTERPESAATRNCKGARGARLYRVSRPHIERYGAPMRSSQGSAAWGLPNGRFLQNRSWPQLTRPSLIRTGTPEFSKPALSRMEVVSPLWSQNQKRRPKQNE